MASRRKTSSAMADLEATLEQADGIERGTKGTRVKAPGPKVVTALVQVTLTMPTISMLDALVLHTQKRRSTLIESLIVEAHTRDIAPAPHSARVARKK